jgi:hypothetical protein
MNKENLNEIADEFVRKINDGSLTRMELSDDKNLTYGQRADLVIKQMSDEGNERAWLDHFVSEL